MAKNKNLKRKPTQFKEKKTQNAEPVAESDSEHEEKVSKYKISMHKRACIQTILLFPQEFELSGVNNEAESSDEEQDKYASDDDSELSFESDDEGNYKPNANKKHQADENGDESDEEIDDDDIEDIDDEELDGEEEEEEEIDDDDIEDIDDEEGEEVDDEDESDDENNVSAEESDDDDDDVAEDVQAKSKKPSGTAIPKTKTKEKKETGALPSTSNTKNANKSTNKKPNEPNAAEKFKNELNKSAPKQSKSTEFDEYEKDTDDEEDIRNTVGNIPMQWYDEYKHIGYDWDAKKIIKPEKGDQLDDFLKRMEDPNFWRTVRDPQTGQEVILSDADIELIKRINSRQIPDAGFNEYAVSGFYLYISINFFSPNFLLQTNFLICLC